MNASGVIPWIAIACLIGSAASYISFLFTGWKLGALLGVGGLGLAILLMAGFFVIKAGRK